MKKESTTKINDNGSYTTKSTRTVTVEDGYIPNSVLFETEIHPGGKYTKGNIKTASYETNDPRVTRAVSYILCIAFIVFGVVLLALSKVLSSTLCLIFGILFISMSIFVFIVLKKAIDRVEKELNESGKFKE